MPVLVNTLVTRASTELNDIEPGYENTHYSRAAIINALNEGINEIARHMPVLFTTVAAHPLVLGQRDQLAPPSLQRVLSVKRNVTTGDYMRPVDYDTLRFTPNIACLAGAPVGSYALDPLNARRFHVDPAPMVATTVDVEGVQAPVDVSDGGTITFPAGMEEQYQAPLLDWILYRRFADDTESATSRDRSMMHYKAFYMAFPGAKRRAEPAKSREGE